ncbi:MAG: sugar ABC transporter permease, partial [Clostridiales bacterium]|nr:sugar ABC transporter permease [Clostridiales bacterium]
MVGVTVFFLIPFGITLYDSVAFGVTGRFVGLENYIQVWNSSTFRLAMGNTLRFLLLGVPLIMVLSFALALLAQKRFAGTRLLRSALLLP